MTNIESPAHKNESSKPLPCLYRKAIYFIETHANRKGVIKNGIIPFPEAYCILSSMLHLGKDEATEVFEELKENGWIEVVPYHGIRIKPGWWNSND